MPKKESPDTESSQDLFSTPNMEGGEEVEGDEAVARPETEAGAEEEFQAFLKKKGLKDYKDLIAKFEEKERKVTDLSNQVLLGSTPQYIPPVERPSERGAPKRGLKVDDSYALATDTEKFNKFLEEVDGYIEEKLQSREDKGKIAQMTREANRLRAKEPEEFDRLRPLMVEMAKLPQYADGSISELFDMAKTQGDQLETAFTERLKKKLGLEGLDTEKLKSLAGRANVAAISSSSGGGTPIKEEGLTDVQRREAQIKTNILKATKLEG